MKNKILIALIAVFMVIASMPLIADQVSAVSVATPTITSLSSEGYTDGTLIVRLDNSANSSIQSSTSMEIANVTTGVTKTVAGSTTMYAFQNLTNGKTYQVKVRAVYVYNQTKYYSSWSSPVSAVVGGSNTSGVEKIELNTWYSGVSNANDPSDNSKCYDWYSFKTTGRSDSKYKFYIKATYGELDRYSADMEIMINGDPELVGYGYFYDEWDSICSYSKKLEPSTSYKVRIWGDDCGFYRQGIEYEFMVKEVIAKPSKGKISSLKAGKKKLTVKYSKLGKASRYQIAYKKKGGSYKYKYTTSTSKTIKSLKSKKYYYVKVRGQRCVGGKYYSGEWSSVKKVKVK